MIMKKTIGAATMLVSALAFSTQAQADAYCSGTISQIYTDVGGAVVILPSWRNDFIQICNVKDVWKDVPTQVCWEWFAHATTAKTDALTVGIYYVGLASNACPTLPTYGNTPGPNYFRLQ